MQVHHYRRVIALGLTVAIFAVVLGIGLWQRPNSTVAQGQSDSFTVKAGTWPMFGGRQDRNMVNLRPQSIPQEFDVENGKNILWKADLGTLAYGGPTIAAGKVFVGTNNDRPKNQRDIDEGRPIDKGIIMCFDQKTGKFLWQAVHDKLPSGLVNDWPREGICSAPVVDGDRLYYVSNQCRVVSADVEGFANGNQGMQNEKFKSDIDADFIWEYDMMAEQNVFPHNLAVCSPLIVGDIVFVVTANGVDAEHINIPAPEAPSFIALDKKTGKLLWKDNSPGRDIMHGQWSNPTYAVIQGVPQVIFPGGDGILYAFRPDTGKLLWKFDCNPTDAKYDLGGRGTRSDFIATPVVYEDKVYIGVGQDPEHLDGVGHMWCIDPTKATPENTDLSPRQNNFDPKHPVNKDSGVVWYFGGNETREGSRREFMFGRTMSTCAIVDDLVYVAELNGYLFCLDANTGKKYWHYDLKSGVWGSAYYVDGKVFIGTEDGELFVFKHEPMQVSGLDEDDYPDRDKKRAIRKQVEEKYLLNKIFVDEILRSTPVAADGLLYLMSERSLWAIGNKS